MVARMNILVYGVLMRKLDPVKHEEKRREILEAAGRCFARSGFQGASISDICAEAGISPGHLYHYFENKEAIVGAMAGARLEAATAHFQKMMESPDALTALVSQLDGTKMRTKRGKQTMVLELLAEAARNPGMAKILQEHSRGMRALLSEFLRKGQTDGTIDPGLDAEGAAAILLSIADGTTALSLRHPKLDMEDTVGLLKILVARFLTPPSDRLQA